MRLVEMVVFFLGLVAYCPGDPRAGVVSHRAGIIVHSCVLLGAGCEMSGSTMYEVGSRALSSVPWFVWGFLRIGVCMIC